MTHRINTVRTRSVGFSSYNLAEKQSTAKRQQVLIDMVLKTRQLTKKDIDNWRQAWQIAINVENPRRNRLLDVYTDVMIDAHLAGSIRNRKIQTMAKSFKVVNISSWEENPDLTGLLETPWFKSFMSLCMDSIFWGFSLIEFGDILSDPTLSFDKVKLIPREHVVPEYNRVLRDPSDEWKKGLDFTMPPLGDWCLGIGDPSDLGILLNASPHVLSKKNMAAYWDQFGEIFGMPMRIATTTSRDPKERTKIETMLEEMGAAAWGLFPDGTEIKIQESTKGDAYNVYDKRIDRCNSELSKLITGETMTMDNGSSLSQSEVHERIFSALCNNDADFVRDIVNTRLFPFLKKHGFKIEGHRFDWDESIEYSPKEQLEIDTLMLSNFDVDPKYFADKYNIPIIGKKEQATPSSFFD
jgi:hypothetical protein